MALTRYERTKAYRHRYPMRRKIERTKHYAKYAYGTPFCRPKYSHEDVTVILTKQWHGRHYVDRLIAKKLRRSLKAIHVYRSLLLGKNTPSKWKVLVHVLQKEGRIWQKQ